MTWRSIQKCQLSRKTRINNQSKVTTTKEQVAIESRLLISTMLHHRPVYDSMEAQEVTSLVGNGDFRDPPRPKFPLLAKRTTVACLVALGVLSLLVANPSWTFDLPLIGQRIHKVHEQNLADDFRLSFLTATPARELKHHAPENEIQGTRWL